MRLWITVWGVSLLGSDGDELPRAGGVEASKEEVVPGPGAAFARFGRREAHSGDALSR